MADSRRPKALAVVSPSGFGFSVIVVVLVVVCAVVTAFVACFPLSSPSLISLPQVATLAGPGPRASPGQLYKG